MDGICSIPDIEVLQNGDSLWQRCYPRFMQFTLKMPRFTLLFFSLMMGCASDIKIAPQDDSSDPIYGLSLSPQAWACGEVEVDSEQVQQFELLANEKVEISSMQLSDGEQQIWRLDLLVEPPLVLSAGSTITFKAYFSPEEEKLYEELLTIASTEENWTIPLSGTGCAECADGDHFRVQR
jgi:hypothetical protein